MIESLFKKPPKPRKAGADRGKELGYGDEAVIADT